jgi:hypothetical protein
MLFAHVLFSPFQQLIGVQDVDSCGKSEAVGDPAGKAEEAPRSPAESEVLHGNQLRC